MAKWVVALMIALAFTVGCSDGEATEEAAEAGEDDEETSEPAVEAQLKAVGCNRQGEFSVVCPEWAKLLKEGWKPVGYSDSIPGPGSHYHFVLFQR